MTARVAPPEIGEARDHCDRGTRGTRTSGGTAGQIANLALLQGCGALLAGVNGQSACVPRAALDTAGTPQRARGVHARMLRQLTLALALAGISGLASGCTQTESRRPQASATPPARMSASASSAPLDPSCGMDSDPCTWGDHRRGVCKAGRCVDRCVFSGTGSDCDLVDGTPGLCQGEKCTDPCRADETYEWGVNLCRQNCDTKGECAVGKCLEGRCEQFRRLGCVAPNLPSCNLEGDPENGTCVKGQCVHFCSVAANDGNLCERPGGGQCRDGKCEPACDAGLVLVGGTHCAKPCRTQADCPGGTCNNDPLGSQVCEPMCPPKCPYKWAPKAN